MNFFKFIFSCFGLLFLLAGYSCKNYTYDTDLFGTYRIYEIVPIDTTSKTSTRIRDAANWTITLKDSNNFEFKGGGERVVGYWAIETKEGKVTGLYLSTAGHTTHAKFGGNTIYFDKPDLLFDSIFRRATFIRKK